MAVLDRISDILKANINDMIDKAEDPEKMVKQLIIDMEDQVDKATQALGQAMGSQKVAAKELADAKAVSADWNDKAKLALKAGNEDLARKALDAKVGVDGQIEQLQKSYDSITEQVNKLKDQVTGLKLDDIAGACSAPEIRVVGVDLENLFDELLRNSLRQATAIKTCVEAAGPRLLVCRRSRAAALFASIGGSDQGSSDVSSHCQAVASLLVRDGHTHRLEAGRAGRGRHHDHAHRVAWREIRVLEHGLARRDHAERL